MSDRTTSVPLAQLEAMNNPLRFEIMASLSSDGPATVHDLAARMGLEELRLYYHLKKLAQAELVTISSVRRTATKPESVFAAVPHFFAHHLDLGDPATAAVVIHNAEVMLKLAAKEYRAAVQSYGNDPERYATHHRYVIRMSSEVRAEFERRFRDLIEWAEGQEAADAPTHSVTLAAAPLVGRTATKP